jgi:Endosomal/lysosomal potassium channel TMEM175
VYRDTMRLVAFSDGVFAITITLLALDIRPPTDDENLLHGLLELWPSYRSPPRSAAARHTQFVRWAFPG